MNIKIKGFEKRYLAAGVNVYEAIGITTIKLRLRRSFQVSVRYSAFSLQSHWPGKLLPCLCAFVNYTN